MWQQQQQLKAVNGINNLISRDCKQKLSQKANSKNENSLRRQREGRKVKIKPRLNWDAIFQQLRNKQAGNGQRAACRTTINRAWGTRITSRSRRRNSSSSRTGSKTHNEWKRKWRSIEETNGRNQTGIRKYGCGSCVCCLSLLLCCVHTHTHRNDCKGYHKVAQTKVLSIYLVTLRSGLLMPWSP